MEWKKIRTKYSRTWKKHKREKKMNSPPTNIIKQIVMSKQHESTRKVEAKSENAVKINSRQHKRHQSMDIVSLRVMSVCSVCEAGEWNWTSLERHPTSLAEHIWDIISIHIKSTCLPSLKLKPRRSDAWVNSRRRIILWFTSRNILKTICTRIPLFDVK